MKKINMHGITYVVAADLAKVVGTTTKTLISVVRKANISVIKFGCPWYINYDAYVKWCDERLNKEWKNE